MNKNSNRTAGTNRFTKNNYFYGKLLTVEDMATEQAYHARVQRTLSRFVTDWGGICGLEVSARPQTDDETGQESLVVTVSEGLALDRCGRLVVVEDEQRRTLPIPVTTEAGEETDTVGVYVEYDECYADPVPAAKMENACEQECKDNHIVEGAELTVVPGEPDESHKSIAEIEFPDAEELGGVVASAQSITAGGKLGLSPPEDRETLREIRERRGGAEPLLRTMVARERSATAESEITEVDIDFALSETESDDTVAVEVSTHHNDNWSLAATANVPQDTLFGLDGFTAPEGSFDVTGHIDFHQEGRVEFSGRLSFELERGSITATARLDFETEDDTLTIPLKFNFDIEDRTFEIDGTIELPDERFTIEGTVSADDREDSYLLRGGIELFEVRDGESAKLGEIDTLPWIDESGEQTLGVLVDKPASRETGEVDIDSVLSGLARSYYRNEPRDSCGGVDDGPVLVGTITATDEDWSSSSFERGPLVYTNDMLFDILARHVSDFDNPHEVSLGVGTRGGPRSGAEIGIEESEGLTGSVELASPDGSVSITPNRGRETIDLQTAGGVGGEYREYLLFERSLWTKMDVYLQILREAPDHDVPQELTGALLEVLQPTLQGLDDKVHRSPDRYVEFLQEHSFLETERRIFELLGTDNSQSELGLLTNSALDTLQEQLEHYEETGEGAPEIAIAQDRVAESMRHYLIYFGKSVDRVEDRDVSATSPGTVPDVTGRSAEVAIRELRAAGRVPRINVVREDTDDLVELREGRINEVVGQDPQPGTPAGLLQPVRIDVVAPPSIERIDGIGPNYTEDLAKYGIETIGELSVATPRVVELATGVSSSEVESWLDTARGYASAYELTRFGQIGTDEAEALYEARSWTEGDSLTDVAPDELLSTLGQEVDRGELKPKFRDRIERIDWNELNSSIERLTDR